MAQINNKGDLDTAINAWFASRGDFSGSSYDDDFVALAEDRIHFDLLTSPHSTSTRNTGIIHR